LLQRGNSRPAGHQCDAVPGAFEQAESPMLSGFNLQTRVQFQANSFHPAEQE